jgi:hypothetical protein
LENGVMPSLAQRRMLRRYPAPSATPEGMVYARHREHGLCLVPEDYQSHVSAKRMGKYDLYPREVRDQMKEGKRRAVVLFSDSN